MYLNPEGDKIMRRVVVTGLGVISPVGNDINSFWNNLINGVCGIGYITRFDTSDYKVKIAAEVKDFHPEEYMEKKRNQKNGLSAHHTPSPLLFRL